MTVVFVEAGDEENLSVRYLASSVEEKGHRAVVLSCSRASEMNAVAEAVHGIKPDIVAISLAFQSMSDVYFQLIEDIRSSGYPGHIIVGGHFPTFDYGRILESQRGIDSIGRFEGEETITQLCEAIMGQRHLSSVLNLVYREGSCLRENETKKKFPDLDSLPFPKRCEKSQVRLGEEFATVISSRGCWHSSCLYCSIGAFHSPKGCRFALRSSKNVAREISMLYLERGVRVIQFHDDNFVLKTRRQTRERLDALRQDILSEGVDIDKLAFLIKARPDVVDDEVARSCGELGVAGCFLGIENASQTGLRSLIRGASIDELETSLNAMRENRIAVTYNLLIFHPNATLDEIDDNMLFVKEHMDLPFDFGRAEVVSGSPLERMLEKNQMLKGSWPHWTYEIGDELVERMFRINHLTFRSPGSLYPRLAESSIALAYQAHTLTRLHPGARAEMLLSRSNTLIEETNRFVLEMMLKMYDLTLAESTEDEVASMNRGLKTGCRKLLDEDAVLRRKMERLTTSDRIFSAFGVGGHAQNRIIGSILGF